MPPSLFGRLTIPVLRLRNLSFLTSPVATGTDGFPLGQGGVSTRSVLALTLQECRLLVFNDFRVASWVPYQSCRSCRTDKNSTGIGDTYERAT